MNRLTKTKPWITSAHRGSVYEGILANTLEAYRFAAEKGADMIEIDARMTRDGVLIVNHDETVKGFTASGEAVEYTVSETDYATLASLSLLPGNPDICRVPTLKEALHVVYFSGMCINIDMKEGLLHAREIARLAVASGMRGRTVYGTNGSGAQAIRAILAIDPEARFIDTKSHFTAENLSSIGDYPARCYVYTDDFSDENIAQIRSSGCMLATVCLNGENAPAAFRHHPDMAEYSHTSDFEAIESAIRKLYAR